MVHAQSARNTAIYILRSDFNIDRQEIAQVFGIADCGRVSHIQAEIIEKTTTSTDLQEKLTFIRSQYSLDIYGGNLVILKQYQKTLFPKQIEEIKDIADEVVKPFKEKIHGIHAKLETLNVSDRNKEILRYYYEGDPTKEIPSYDTLGQTYNISRERIRQILVNTMRRLTPTLEPSEADLMMNYTREFEKVRLVVELQNL